VFLSLGRLEEAEAELSEALRVAREVGNPAQLRLTLARWVVCVRRRGGRRRRGLLSGGNHRRGGVARALSDASLRETLLASPQVAALREAVL
jgi:hypothetical protein